MRAIAIYGAACSAGTLALLTMLWHALAPVLAGATLAAAFYGDTFAGVALGLAAGLGQFAAPAMTTALTRKMDALTDRARRAEV